MGVVFNYPDVHHWGWYDVKSCPYQIPPRTAHPSLRFIYPNVNVESMSKQMRYSGGRYNQSLRVKHLVKTDCGIIVYISNVARCFQGLSMQTQLLSFRNWSGTSTNPFQCSRDHHRNLRGPPKRHPTKAIWYYLGTINHHCPLIRALIKALIFVANEIHQDCNAGFSNWLHGWSDSKQHWCCEKDRPNVTCWCPFDLPKKLTKIGRKLHPNVSFRSV